MTKLEFIQWCEANNVPDDAVLVFNDDGIIHTPRPIIKDCFAIHLHDRNVLGITDTTPMVVEL